jgi:hypothetical protein
MMERFAREALGSWIDDIGAGRLCLMSQWCCRIDSTVNAISRRAPAWREL